MIRGVLFDLDDTLFDQRQWLDGAWAVVAEEASRRLAGLDAHELYRALVTIAGEGSAKGGIIDRALARLGWSAPLVPASLVPALVEAFRRFRAPALEPYPGVRDALAQLRDRARIGLVTDGEPGGQRDKLRALGLADQFDVVVFSDELGRERRKPHPAPFQMALEGLGLTADCVVHVGDHPLKDVRGAEATGLRAVRVLTGEYRDWPSDPEPWMTVGTATDACHRLNSEFRQCPI